MVNTEKNWHFDKKVPIAIFFALLCNLFAGIWYAAKIDSRVAALELATRDNTQVIERLVRVETQLDGLKDAVNRIDQGMSKLVTTRN